VPVRSSTILRLRLLGAPVRQRVPSASKIIPLSPAHLQHSATEIAHYRHSVHSQRNKTKLLKFLFVHSMSLVASFLSLSAPDNGAIICFVPSSLSLPIPQQYYHQLCHYLFIPEHTTTGLLSPLRPTSPLHHLPTPPESSLAIHTHTYQLHQRPKHSPQFPKEATAISVFTQKKPPSSTWQSTSPKMS